MEQPVRCQLFHTNEASPFATLCVAPRQSLSQFRSMVERLAPKFRAGAIRYVDDEGDQITIETDIELEEALKLGQKLGQLKVFVDGVKVEETPAPAPAPAPVQVPVKEEPQPVPAPKVVHRAICDNCKKYITGIRYKCGNCPDYDLCEACEELSANQPGIHPEDHVFLKIRRPICSLHRLSLPNLYQPPAVRKPHPHCIVARGRCVIRPANATPAPAAAPPAAPASTPAAPNNHEERISALEATVARLAKELSSVTEEKRKIEERKKLQEQKRKELKEILQKKSEERAALKAERKMKKQQQQQQRVAAKVARQVKLAGPSFEVTVEVPAPAPVQAQEQAKVEEVVEVKVEEPVQQVQVEEIPQQQEKKEEEPKEEPAAEEEKKDDDFVVISQEAPAQEDERRSFFKEALETLASMGFSDIDRNLHLLAHFAGDLNSVIHALLEMA